MTSSTMILKIITSSIMTLKIMTSSIMTLSFNYTQYQDIDTMSLSIVTTLNIQG